MPLYSYKARSDVGALVTGTLESSSREAVAEQLDGMGYIPISIKEKKGLLEIRIGGGPKIKSTDLIVFSRQFSTLINSGIPLITTLETLADQSRNPRMKEVILQIRRDVGGGITLSEAFLKHPKVFSPLYSSMIRVGEEGGVLGEILDRLASLLEHEAETRSRVKAAMRYPIIVVVAIVIAFTVLVTLVIPKFAALFAQFKAQLPLPTRILIGINYVIKNYWYFILGSIFGAYYAFRVYISTKGGRKVWDRVKIRLPILGELILKVIMSRFSRIFATLYRSGLPMLQTLEIISNTLNNVIIAAVIESVKGEVREGRGLSGPMRASGVFPPIVSQMVAIGEESGNLDTMLTKVSDYYDSEVEYAIRNFSTMLEPVLLVVIGTMVLFLALGVFLPLWDLISVMRR